MFFHGARQISLRRVVLLSGDICCIALSLILSSMIRLLPVDGWHYVIEHIPSLMGSCLIFLVVFYAGGMYERQTLTRMDATYKLPLITVIISVVLIVVVFYARFQLHIGRGILFLAAFFIFLGTWLMRSAYHAAVSSGLLSKKTLVVGDGKEMEDAVRLITQTADSGLKILGIISCHRKMTNELLLGLPVVGTVDRLRELADVFSAETIIVATPMAKEPAVLRLLRPLRYSGIEIMDYIALHEMLAQEIPLNHINDEWLMSAAMNSSVIHIRKIKRIMDISVAVMGLIVTLPISVITALLIKLESAGPVLYRQRRSGLDGHEYVLMKFRTMKHDAEATSGAVWAEKFDRRVTRIGVFLRKWRIDEIPQLINVLRGEMSLVGPRPERPEFIETLAKAIPFYKERLLVPPGVTGWAQVKYPYAASVDAARRKLQYDLFYIKHMSFFLDASILLRTFRTIIVGLRHSEAEESHQDEIAAPVLTILPPEEPKSSSHNQTA